jgi:hypothetical protein
MGKVLFEEVLFLTQSARVLRAAGFKIYAGMP